MSTDVKPIVTEHSTEWHWWAFSDFCKLKALVKEPSPHMQMIGELARGKRREEVIWLTGLYAAFYNIPSALVMWNEIDWETAIHYPRQVEDWIIKNWRGTTTRTERRAARTPKKMTESILSYIGWADIELQEFLDSDLNEDTNAAYNMIWKSANDNLRYMGRYIIIRLLESLHRFAGLEPRLYDIRSIGGWSPKRALGLLWPEFLDLLLSPDTKENVQKVDALALHTMKLIKERYDVDMSPYVFAAMLCEYRVCYENRHQYPGWTIDQEPAHWNKIMEYWLDANGPQFVTAIETQFYGVRALMFPSENLGENNGWAGTRPEPTKVLRDYGYNWFDAVYDYRATTDFSNPVRR